MYLKNIKNFIWKALKINLNNAKIKTKIITHRTTHSLEGGQPSPPPLGSSTTAKRQRLQSQRRPPSPTQLSTRVSSEIIFILLLPNLSLSLSLSIVNYQKRFFLAIISKILFLPYKICSPSPTVRLLEELLVVCYMLYHMSITCTMYMLVWYMF
jgi:hypothetical protein